jgi:beta-phosphoglucomutase-like phosphatase (HAD superfamily)
MEGKNF